MHEPDDHSIDQAPRTDEQSARPVADPPWLSETRLVPPRMSTYFKSWIIFFLIATVGGSMLGFICGGIIGAVLGAGGASMQAIKLAAGGFAFLLALPISFFTFHWSVKAFIVTPLLQSRSRSRPP